MNLSIELCVGHETRKQLIPEVRLLQIVKGCRDGLERLGTLREAVRTIRLAHEDVAGRMRPILRIFYEDPLGQESEYKIHFYTYPDVADESVAKQISDRIAKADSACLGYFIKAHLLYCRDKVAKIEKKINDQLST